MMDSTGKPPRRGRTTRGKGRRIRENMPITLNSERDPVLTNMSKLEVTGSYAGLVWDLGEEVKRFVEKYHGDEEYIKDADLLTVILHLVDRARDHALELSVRPLDNEVGKDV